MSNIIAGRFGTLSQVQAVVDELAFAHFQPEEFASYYVNPLGEEGLQRMGPAAHRGGKAVVSGAKPDAISAAVLPGNSAGDPHHGQADALLASPETPNAGKAWLTALAQPVANQHEPPKAAASPEPGAGPMIAICVDRPGTEQLARVALQRHGAQSIELQKGRWEKGDWKDYEVAIPGQGSRK